MPDEGSPAVHPGVTRLPPVAHPATPASVGAETLEEAWTKAELADAELQAARHRALAARKMVQSANSLQAPRVSLGGAYNVRTDELALSPPIGSPFLPGQFAFSQSEGVMLGGVVTYPLYTGGQITQSRQAAQFEATAAEMALQKTHLELKIAVAQAFLAVLEAEAMLETAEMSLTSLEAHRQSVERFHEQQMVAFADALEARAAVADARQNRLHAENNLQIARADYNRLLGRPFDVSVNLRCPESHRTPHEVQVLLDAASTNRPELAQLAYEAEVFKRRAEAVEANNRPQIHAGAAYWFEENRFRSPEGLGSLGVTAMWNVYDGHHHGHQATALRHQAAAIERQRAGLVEQIWFDIRRAWLRHYEAECLITEAAESVRLAEENLQCTQQRYRVGMATSADVLSAEATRTQHIERATRARYRSLLAELELRAAAGLL